MPDYRGYLLPNERRVLLNRYAPVLVLFPELPRQAPYPDEGDAIYTVRGSYHPRAVNFFLEKAIARYRRAKLGVFPRSLSPFDEIAHIESTLSDADIRSAMELYREDPRYAGFNKEQLHDALRKRLIQQRLGTRVAGFDLPLFRTRNIAFWGEYIKLLRELPPEKTRSVVYGRLLQGRAPLNVTLATTEAMLKQEPEYGPYDVSQTRVALQYWFHYFYDDWANRHEGDWEGITILVEINRDLMTQNRDLSETELLDGVEVKDVSYAVHEDGYRRLWSDVQKTTEGRPIVYVSRGSSASYFAWRLEGYPASARLGVLEKILELPGRVLRGRRVFGRRWDAQYAARITGRDPKNIDWVAADPLFRDRLGDSDENVLEHLLPYLCQGVRRRPDFSATAGLNSETYQLETEDLFWLELVQEYGVQWGENAPFPGAKGPKGISKSRRDKARREIYQLALVETIIERALDTLGSVRFDSEQAIPELNPILRRLRPRNLQKEHAFSRSIQLYVYIMWAWILQEHPEAWPYGPGLRLRLILRGIMYPGVLRFIRGYPGPDPLLVRRDPMYHLKTLLSQVRRTRYERQQEGSHWDNPFAWVRHVCNADTFFYGKAASRIQDESDLLRYIDCQDAKMSME